MRKYLLFVILIIFIIIFICVVTLGIGKINSYGEISKLNEEKEEILVTLKNKNSSEFKSKISELGNSISEYKTTKAEYDSLVASGELAENAIYSSMDIYNLDFLWATIGNYATQNGLTLQIDVTKSSTATSISPDCLMCNLNFMVTGDYIPITDFIYNIEDDDKLNFEIKNFLLEKGGENLQATFVVKDVPINSKNLSSIPISSSAYIDE